MSITGFWAPGKANLPGTLGRHCLDLVPTFRAGCVLKATVPTFSSFPDRIGKASKSVTVDPRLGRSWAQAGPILGPRGSRPDSPCALFYSISDPSRSRGGGHPGPSWSHPGPGRSFQDRAWTGRNRLLGHFRQEAS